MYNFDFIFRVFFLNTVWGGTTDSVSNESANFPLRNQPPVVSSCSNCRVVSVYFYNFC